MNAQHQMTRATPASRNSRQATRRPNSASPPTRSTRKVGARWRAAAVAITLGCALSACGGGGGGAPDTAVPSAKPSTPVSAPATASAPTSPATVHILFEGDSTMYGTDAMSCQNPNCQNYNNEPDTVVSLLNNPKGLGPNAVDMINDAVPSTFLQQMLPGNNPQYPYSFVAVLESVPSQIVVSNHAINDSVMETTDQYEGYLNTFIDDTLASGKIPVLDEPNPVCDNKRPNLDFYVAVLRAVAAQRNVLLIPQYDSFKAIPNWETLLPDCVHPSTNGYAVKARNTAQALIPIVRKVGGR